MSSSGIPDCAVGMGRLARAGGPLQATPPVLICLVTASVHCAVGMGPILWEGLLGLEDHYKLCHLSIGFDICSNGIPDCAVGMGRPARAGGSS